MLKGCSWVVGDGASIPVREATWLPDKQPYFIQFPRIHNINMVNDLIDEVTGFWKEDLIRATFNDHEADCILRIPVGENRIADRLCCCNEKLGDYTVGSGYRLLL